MNIKKQTAIVAIGMVSLSLFASSALAVTYSLTNADAAFGSFPAGYGTVSLTQEGSGLTSDVLVTVTLASGVAYNAAGGSSTHHNFAFNLLDPSTAKITLVGTSSIANFTAYGPTSASAYTNTPYGNYNAYIDFTSVSNNSNAFTTNLAQQSQLTFKVAQIGNTDIDGIVISDFIDSVNTVKGTGGGYAFSADIVTLNNSVAVTGNVATGSVAAGGGSNGGGSNAIPEPTTIALLGLGLMGFAISRRRKTPQ